MSYDMGYYGGGDQYADYQQMYEEQEEQYEEPPQRQQNAPRSPGLRAHMRQMTADNKALKKELEEQRAMIQELMEGDGPQTAGPQVQGRPFASDAEVSQYQHMLSQGAMPAAPMGSQAEQIAQIRNAQSPQELLAYLASQGNTNGTGSYQGMGYQQ